MGLSTHVLDTAHGKPAVGMEVLLYQVVEGNPILVSTSVMNKDGRPDALLYDDGTVQPGLYRLVFSVAEYYRRAGVAQAEIPFLDKVTIDFGISDLGQHYHVPLLVSPWSYSTYRGS